MVRVARKSRITFALFFWGPFAVSALAGTPQTQELKGEVLNEAGKPLVGAVCTLTGGPLPDTGLSVATGEKGEFNFTGLLPSTYRLTCAAADYEPVMKQDLQIGETPPPFVQMVLPPEIVVRQKVEVREKAPVISPENVSAPAKITSTQLMTLPLTEQRFKAALPLVPGVVRTPDGKINIKGAAESQGMMLVDGAETVDPVTGAFAIEVPIDAVGSVDVFKTAYQAEYGRFAGGLASVQTKAPSDKFHFELNDLTPNMRGKSGHLVGISEESPRIDVTGPLLPGKLDFFEAFNYDLHKQPVRGLAWPKNEIKKEGIDSFTSLQYIISTQHLLTGNLKVFPERLEFADINSLVPQSASSNYEQRGFSAGVKDRYLFPAGGILTSFLQFTNFSSYAHGQGPLDMLVTPNGWGEISSIHGPAMAPSRRLPRPISLLERNGEAGTSSRWAGTLSTAAFPEPAFRAPCKSCDRTERLPSRSTSREKVCFQQRILRWQRSSRTTGPSKSGWDSILVCATPAKPRETPPLLHRGLAQSIRPAGAAKLSCAVV